MKLFEGPIGDLPALERTVVTVGKFDGVHRGHRALLQATVAVARIREASAVAFTFDRHPVELLRPGTEARFLMTIPERLEQIAALGLDVAVVLRLTPEFLNLSPEQFAGDVLAGRLGIEEIVASESFRFGRGAAGTLATLRESGERLGFTVEVVPPVIYEGERISSSRVVQAIQAGDVATAAALLGHPYSLAGEVVTGARIGRTLGFPTANLATHPLQHLPSDGVYVVEARWNKTRLQGVANLGVRPTVGGTARVLEAYFFDFADNLYGETIRLSFLARLRDQARFPSLEALRDQIARDVAAARDLLMKTSKSG